MKILYKPCIINDLLSGLVSVWEFEETSGTTAYDSHGTHHGTINAGITMGEPGKIGNCFKFVAATNSNVMIPDHDDFSYTNGVNDRGITISAWVKFRIIPNSINLGWLVAKRQSSLSHHEFQFNYSYADGGFNFILYSESTNNRIYSTYTIIPIINTWYHIIGTYNGAEEKDGLRNFLNGIKSNFNNEIGTYVKSNNTAEPIYIGRGSWGNYWHDGWMDQVAIWKRKLSNCEIKAIYNNGNGRPYSEWSSIKGPHDSQT